MPFFSREKVVVEQIKQFRIPGVRTLLFFDSDVMVKTVRVNGELFGHNNPFNFGWMV